jgi:hypothetical protein
MANWRRAVKFGRAACLRVWTLQPERRPFDTLLCRLAVGPE